MVIHGSLAEYAIAGARCRIRDPEAAVASVQRWALSHDTEVLLIDARAVFGRDHLESAVRHALRARRTKSMLARTVGMETLLYLTGQHQVSTALRIAGLRKGTTRVALVAFGELPVSSFLKEKGWTRADSVLEPGGKSLHRLRVTSAERGTVPASRQHDLALERVALLDVVK